MLVPVGLRGGHAYSLPPVAAMRRGSGEILNALLGGLLLPLFGVAIERGTVAPLDVLAFLPMLARAALAAAVLAALLGAVP
jgi:1,4-dihydroxy-2-naphthoate polyprenyltransferase